MREDGESEKDTFMRLMFAKTETGEKPILNPFMEAYKLTGQAKVNGSLDFLNVLIENDNKFILFCHHISTLNQYEAAIKKLKVRYIRIDGKTG
jgi:SNF2 family DNA or RNA helicase